MIPYVSVQLESVHFPFLSTKTQCFLWEGVREKGEKGNSGKEAGQSYKDKTLLKQ